MLQLWEQDWQMVWWFQVESSFLVAIHSQEKRTASMAKEGRAVISRMLRVMKRKPTIKTKLRITRFMEWRAVFFVAARLSGIRHTPVINIPWDTKKERGPTKRYTINNTRDIPAPRARPRHPAHRMFPLIDITCDLKGVQMGWWPRKVISGWFLVIFRWGNGGDREIYCLIQFGRTVNDTPSRQLPQNTIPVTSLPEKAGEFSIEKNPMIATSNPSDRAESSR